ncbi:interleukin-1 receptor-associated kinase 3 [Platichthys flesus]|uniref:interleukin-1 receptor-associated kinase 3 n=1 Tax=Platichthys flesus TaxID=8260 RepID=UPI002DBABAF9|nr:interleukin-1 receptor-associated kinase 3 [Platichthys flesus]
MDPDTLLYDVPPALLESFHRIMDGGGDTLGWRGLAVRILPSYLELRMLERLEAAGRSPSSELLWSWAQQNKRVRDLQKVLQDMGHLRALQLFQGPAQVSESPSPPSDLPGESTGQMSAAEVKESPQPEASSSSQPSIPMWSAAENHTAGLTFQDVIEGTRSFHPETRIAEGHFANVYRARIGSNTFAVKLFKQINGVSWKKLWDAFRKEMEIHHMYQHPNIVELLDCFSDEDHYCLVYPYLPNGSLYHRLHPQDGEPPLFWEERLTIIKGIAKALHHLHMARPCQVICGNVSSGNILLDDALQPKLSDFGLARLRPYSASQQCTITLDMGSHSNPGYLPEEYIRDGKLSFSLDVYSFGMVIMETVTGRKVIEDAPKQQLLRDLLVTEVENSGGVDSCLRFLDETAGRWPTAMAVSLLALALECTASPPRLRPSMENVLLTLSQLLPPPRCPLADQPRSLHDEAAVSAPQSPSSSIPVEHDEQRSPLASLSLTGPCEYSQSEVAYLSDTMGAHREAEPDLYGSLPVECSCSAEAAGQACEDCRANRMASDFAESPQYSSMVENKAKRRLRDKLSLYNKGLVHTEELFSEAGLQ